MSEENQDPIDEQREDRQQEPIVEWYIQVGDGKKAGPISFERLKNFAERGKIVPATNVRGTGPDAVWTPARDVPELFPNLPAEELEEDAETTDDKPADDPGDEASVEEPSADAVEVTDDSRAVATPKVLVDIGRKRDEKPAEKPKKKKAPAFVIDATVSKKRADEPVGDDPPEERKEPSSPGVKISIGAPAGKKPAKKDKSSVGFKFAIDPTASKKKEEKSTEPVVEHPPEEAAPVAKPTKPELKKKGDASAPGIRISIGAPAGKKKDGEKSSEKSASAFKVAVKPTGSSESKVEEKKKSNESTVITKTSKAKPKKWDEEDTDSSTDFELKKPKTGFFGMRILGILSALLGTFGGLALGFLSRESVGPAFGVTLAVVLAFFGVVLCLAFWLTASFLSKINET